MGQGSSHSKLEDRYHVQKVKLGTGSFGTVWRAVDKDSNAIVAVKQLDKSAIAQRGIKRQDVEREIAMMRSCVHEHIIRLFEIFVDKSSIHLALEYCDGGDFGDKIRERGRNMQDEEAGAWMSQVLSAIAALHSKSICHRDIKPDNFMLSGNTLKLADFGIAIPVQRGQLLVDKCGTPAFMAPEQHLLPRKSQGYSFPVDLWAAGILMYMLMENRHPFINAKGKLAEEQLMNGHLIFSECEASFFSASSFSSFLRFSNSLKSFSLDRFLFSEDTQDRFSKAARRFCRCLVCPNPATRLTAYAALHDPWLTRKPEAAHEQTAQRGLGSRAPCEQTMWCMPEETMCCIHSEEPDGGMWQKSPDGYVPLHHFRESLSPAHAETPGKLSGVEFTSKSSQLTSVPTKMPQSQVNVLSQNRAEGPETSQITHVPAKTHQQQVKAQSRNQKVCHEVPVAPPPPPPLDSPPPLAESQIAPVPTKAPQHQTKVPQVWVAPPPPPDSPPPESQIASVPTKTHQHPVKVQSRNQKIGTEAQAAPPPPDSPPPESHARSKETGGRGDKENRYNGIKSVNSIPEPSQITSVNRLITPRHQVKVSSRNQKVGTELQVAPPPPLDSPPESQITPGPAKASQHQVKVPSRNQKIGPEVQVAPPPPDSPPPESRAHSNRYNDSKYVNLVPAMFGDK